ncbi:MAG: hypothetical protein ABIH23_09615, partial [bacterium]
MIKGAAAMGQSLRWFVVACAVIGVLSSVGISTASGQTTLPRQNTGVAPWFLPLGENVRGADAVGGVISNVSAILAASPTAFYSGYALGRVDAAEDGYVITGGASRNNPGSVTYGQYSVLYRWLVKDLNNNGQYGAVVANLQPQDTMVMAAVVANVNSASVAKLRAGTLTAAEYTGLLSGVTADFSVNSSGGTLFPTYKAVYPSSATGVSTSAKDATLVVFIWAGDKLTDKANAASPANLTIPATPVTTNDNGFRATLQLVGTGGRSAVSNYVGFDVKGPALRYVGGKPDIKIVGGNDIYGRAIPGTLKQTDNTVVGTNGEIKWGDVLIVDATFTTNAVDDGEPDAYFGANNDTLVDAYNPSYLPLGSAVVASSSIDGNFAAALLRQENQIDVKSWSTTIASPEGIGTGANKANKRAVALGEAGVDLMTRNGGVVRNVTASSAASLWNSGSVVLRATFVVTDASTVASANGALDIGNNAMPIHFIVGDELGLSHTGSYTLGTGAGDAPLAFRAAPRANVANGTVAQVTGYVDNRPPIIIRAVMRSNDHARAKGGEGDPGTARGIIGPGTPADSVGLQIDISLEEEEQSRSDYFLITLASDTNLINLPASGPIIVLNNTAIWSVSDLDSPANVIWGVSCSYTFDAAHSGAAVSNRNAGIVVTVTDDARNFWTFNSALPDLDGDDWSIMGVAGTPKASTVVVDAATPVLRAATMFVTQNIVGTEGIAGKGTSTEGTTIGNTQVITLLTTVEGSNAKNSAGTILGATIGSPASKLRILVEFDPDTTSADPALCQTVDKALAAYPDDGSHGDLRTQFSYVKPAGNAANVLGINETAGLFKVDVSVPMLGLTPADFTVISSATYAQARGAAGALLEAVIPPVASWANVGGVNWAVVGSATGIGYVTAVVEVVDTVGNRDYMGPNDPTGHSGAVVADNHAFAQGIVADSTMPLVLKQNPAANAKIAAVTGGLLNPPVYMFATINNTAITPSSFNTRTGLALAGTTIGLASRPVGNSKLAEVKSGDWLVIEAGIFCVTPTIRSNAALSNELAGLWPAPNALQNIPYLITADFSDFVTSATDELPRASRTLYREPGSVGPATATPLVGDNGKIASATSGDIILVTFGLKITDNLVTSISMVRSVTINVWDPSGNVSQVGLYGATADFGAPQVTVTQMKLNGLDASTLPGDPFIEHATAGVGDRLDVYATVTTAAGAAAVQKLYGDFRSFGVGQAGFFDHNQSAAGPPTKQATISYVIANGSRVTRNSTWLTANPDLSAAGISAGSAIAATFTYNTFAAGGTTAAINTAAAKVTIGATNVSNVKHSDDSVSIGYDFYPPLINYAKLTQIAKLVSADSLTDNQVRPGDTMRVVARIPTDLSDRQGRSGLGSDVNGISITPTADLTNYGLSASQAPNSKGWNRTGGQAADNVLHATWEFVVGSPAQEGVIGPYSIDVYTVDAVGNTDDEKDDNTVGKFFVENAKPIFAAGNIITRVSQPINVVGGNKGTINTFYQLPGKLGTGWTRSATETVKAGNVVHVTAQISLNDDVAKVQINNTGLRFYGTAFDPGMANGYKTPAYRSGSTNITARWEVTVTGSAPTYRPAGVYTTEEQIKITATDTANLSTTKVDDATVEVDNTPPVVAMEQKFYVAKGALGPNDGADRTSDIITGRDSAAVLAGPATFTAKITASYGSPITPHLPGKGIGAFGGSYGGGLANAALAALDDNDLGNPATQPDLFTLTGAGPLVTSGSSAAQIKATTNTTVTYYYYNYGGALSTAQMAQLGAYVAGGGNPAAQPHAGFTVSGAAASKVAAKLIGYASDDVGNVTPTATQVAAADSTYASLFTIKLDNTQPTLANYTNRWGVVKNATWQVITTDNVNIDYTKPRLSSGDVVLVTFSVSDPTNNTTPLKVALDMSGIYQANDVPTFSSLWVENSPSAAGTYVSANRSYVIDGITPAAANDPADGHFRFTVGTQTSNPVLANGNWTSNNIPGAVINLNATDAIGLSLWNVGGALVSAPTMEIDNQAPLFIAKGLKRPNGAALNAALTSDKVDSNAHVHVAVKQPGGNWEVLDPPSVNTISQDLANPTLIRASATVYSDSVVTLQHNMETLFDVGNDRLTIVGSTITPGSGKSYLLNVTASINKTAQPIQPQHIKLTAIDSLGNSQVSTDANVLGINAQGVFLLEKLLYVNGVNVQEGAQGGAAKTSSGAPDRQLTGAASSLDELRPGDELKLVATLGNDSDAPDVLTANFSAFYPPMLAPRVVYMVPSATQAGAGNTTIATWEVATVNATDVWGHDPNPGVQFASLRPGAATMFLTPGPGVYPTARQGINLYLANGQLVMAAMPANRAPAGFGQDVLGAGKLAVQNVWNMNNMGNLTVAQRLTQATGTQPNVAAKVTVAATDLSSLFPATTFSSDSLIVDTQPPEVDVTLNTTVPAAFRTAGDGHTFNRVTGGDQITVGADLTNPDVLRTGNDAFAGGAANPTLTCNLSGFGLSTAEAFTIGRTVVAGGAPTIYKSSGTVTVGESVGNTDQLQQTVVNVAFNVTDDVGNGAVEVLHEQRVAVDNFPPSVFRASLGVQLREGTATYGVPPNVQQIVVQAGEQGQRLQSGWRVAPGSILRVSAVIGDSLDDPLGFLAPDRISLTVSKVQGATISLVTQTAVISLTNAAVPFNVELPPAERLDTTIGFGFIVAVTDVLGNVKIEDAIGSFDVDGRPIIEGLASTDNGRLVDQAADDGASVAINADEILTLALTATDFGTVVDLDVVQTPDPAAGSSVSVAKSAMDQTTVTATVTVTPDVPTYGVGPSDALNLKATATDDTGLTIVQDDGVTVTVNDLSLFSPLFDGMIDTTAIALTSDDIGRLSAAGADVREVTIGEGTKLTVTIEARDMTAADAVTLEVTGTAISSAATIAGATLNGVDVLDAAASPTVAIVESGSIEFIFEPGYKAVPYGSASDVATFTLRAWVADAAQIAADTQKDYVDIIVNVTPEVTTPVVTVTDVELVNAGGATSVSLGSVAAANVQETSTAIVTVSAADAGGEPVTLTFANSSTIVDVRDNGTPA